MKKLAILIMVLLPLFTNLTACGQSGKLYLPEEQRAYQQHDEI